MTSTVTVMFSQDELVWCEDLARARDEVKQRAGIGRAGTYAGRVDTYTMHYDNVRAELAVCKALRQSHGIQAAIDQTISVRGHTKGNIVMHMERELRAFARYRSKRGWDLALKSASIKHFYGDLGFLVWPRYVHTATGALDVIGWINRAEFASMAVTTAFRSHERRLAVPVRALQPMTHYPTTTYEPSATQAALL